MRAGYIQFIVFGRGWGSVSSGDPAATLVTWLWVRMVNTACDGLIHMHDDVIKWKHFLRGWPYVRGIYRSPVNSPPKGQWRGALMFFFDLRRNTRLNKQSRRWYLIRHRGHYYVIEMYVRLLRKCIHNKPIFSEVDKSDSANYCRNPTYWIKPLCGWGDKRSEYCNVAEYPPDGKYIRSTMYDITPHSIEKKWCIIIYNDKEQ